MTRAQMRARVRRRLKWDADDSEAMAVINDALQDAYDLVNGHRAWRLLRETTTSAVTSATTTLDVPTDWGTLDIVSIYDSNGDSLELDFITWAEQLHEYGDPTVMSRGTPKNYLLVGAADGVAGARKFQMHLAPYSSASYTLRLVGITRPAALDDDADVPWFDSRWHIMLPEYAQAQLMEEEEGFDPRVANNIRSRAERRLSQMVWMEPDGVTPTTSVPLIE